MKHIKLFSLIVFLLFFLFSKNLLSQSEEFLPFTIVEDSTFEMPFMPTETSSSTYGYVHTPKGHLHMLVIFVGYNNTTSADDVGTPGTETYWAHDDIPNWAKGDINHLFCKEIEDIGEEKNLSSFYYTVSDGEFLVTGEIFPEQVMVDPGEWQDSVIRRINENPDYDNYNWGRFDLRTNCPAFNYDNSTSSPDNKLDYVYFVFRNLSAFTGNSGVGGTHHVTTNYGGTTQIFTICDGHTAKYCFNSPKHHWIFYKHEFAHNLYLSSHYLGANGSGADGMYYYVAKGWGLMASWHEQWDVANSWESWWLGWIEPQVITQNGIYTISDFITTGDAIKIPIPNTSEEYLWIENHRHKLNYPFTGIDFDNKPFYDPPSNAPGLFVFVTKLCDDRSDPGEMTQFSLASTNFIKPLNANGNWDFYYNGLQI